MSALENSDAARTGGAAASNAEDGAGRRRWRLGRWIAGALLLLLLVALIPTGAAYLASRLLANASPPTGVEFPPTPAALLASGTETTALAGQGRGLNCSIPRIVENVAFDRTDGLASPSARYRQACVAHDLCYRHGAATYGYTQADCDQMLMRSAFRLCKKTADAKRMSEGLGPAPAGSEADDATYRTCVDEARMVFFGVFMGGATAFRPVEPRDGGRIAALEGSGPAEYDAFPAGGASYSVARLVRGEVASLVLFRRSAGGGKYVRRDWTGAGFAPPVSARVRGRWEDQPAPPLVAPGSGSRPDAFVWWRRSIGAEFPTNGSFAVATILALDGKTALDPGAASPNLDPGSSQFFLVPGRSPDGLAHFVGVTEFPGEWDQCSTGSSGIQIMHATLDLRRSGARPTFRCAVHEVVRSVDGPARPERVGSYLGEPPALSFDGNAIKVTLFRRNGERRASDYADLLSGLTVRIPLDDVGDRRPRAERRCWRLAESEEPFFAPGGLDGSLATFTFSGANGAVDPDSRRTANLFLKVIGSAPSGSECSGLGATWRLPTESRSYLKARVVHVRIGPGSGTRLSDATDALVMTRMSASGGLLQASALVITMNAGGVVACTQSFFDAPGPIQTTVSDASRRAATLQPIVGDLNRDGTPDLVFADTTGGEPFGFLGIDGGRGRLGFAAPSKRNARVSNAGCEKVK